jgi:hypothetical protein
MKKLISSFFVFLLVIVVLPGCTKSESGSKTFYINNISGNDANDGLSPKSAWKSLDRAGAMTYKPGDKLLLAKGCTFYGKLELKGGVTEQEPVVVSAYDSGNGKTALPVIDAKGYTAAIRIENGQNFHINNLEITADAGEPQETEARTKRYGILITADQPGIYANFLMEKLKIHHIFATENVKGNGQNPTSNMGYGIFIAMKDKNARISNIHIEDCSIEMTGHTGIRIFGFGDNSGSTYLDSVTILKNRLINIGGPGMVPGRCENVLVRGNVVDHSGSSADPRMHARGSGIWPWTCNNVLIEKNKFMHARGKADSCGAHIDFNCNNVVVQYNLSLDNAGGFVEILGNDNNCCYRYNVSINDGFRIKGENGADQEGKILWTSGYVGGGNKKDGPYNSYIYNNTVYVKEDIRSCFSFTRTTVGILIANNIFYILGETADVSGDQDTQVEDQSQTISNVVFTNNLYENAHILPASLIIKDDHPVVGDPRFQNTGGVNVEDYIPANTDLVKDKGIEITKIPGDPVGLTIGLAVETDILGNNINGAPDMGAIEMN